MAMLNLLISDLPKNPYKENLAKQFQVFDHSYLGTQFYYAPEMVLKKGYNK